MMDSRGVSIALQYVLLVAIIGILTGVLLTGTGGFVRDQQEEAARDGLEVIGAGLAADIEAVDRLADTTELDRADSLKLRVETPETVAGSSYFVTIHENGTILLVSPDLGEEVTVKAVVTHKVTESTISGGPMEIRLNSGELEVVNDR